MLQMLLLQPHVAAATGAYLLWRRLRRIQRSEVWTWSEPAPARPRPAPEPVVELTDCSVCSSSFPADQARGAPLTPELTERLLTGQLCPDCWKSKGEPLERRYREACERAKDIEVYSKRFKTRLPIDRQRAGREVTSSWAMTPEACERQLQVAAAFHGFDIVVGVVQDRQPHGDRPVRATFQLKGKALYLSR